MSHQELVDLQTYEDALAGHGLLVLFKHSPICPTSAAALQHWQRFRSRNPALATLQVDVIAARPVSRAIAAASGVEHQSPQAILFVRGKAVWSASHDAITEQALAAACAQHGATP